MHAQAGAQEQLRMHDMRQDFQALHQARTRAAEVRRTVRRIDAAFTHRGQILGARKTSKHFSVGGAALKRVTAARQHDHLGRQFHHAAPFQSRGRPMKVAQLAAPAGDFDQLGYPVTSAEGRVHPLKAQNARAPRGTRAALADRFDAGAK